MKKHFLFLLLFFSIFLNSFSQNNDRQLILNTTGYGFDRNTTNGIATDQWDYIQKFANLSYNGQDASVTAVRFYVDWGQYEPTLGDYHGAKLATAVQTILATHSGMKIALHFDYKRPGPMPDGLSGSDTYFGDEDLARTNNGSIVRATIAYSCPSVFSETARTRFYAFVNDAMSHLSAYYSSILYVEMGCSQAEEFAMPYLFNGIGGQGFYEDKALQSWRTEYLPCRYPGQTNVTWNGTSYAIASAPSASNPGWDWNDEHQREYHRFASWGLMRLYKGLRDAVKSHNSSIKVIYFISDFGSTQGNLFFMHSATIPMALQEFDGIYTSDGGQYDDWRKIMAVDVMKSTNPNKIAGIEFDQDDLGQQNPSNSSSPLNPNMVTEWIPRAYKHGVNYVHLAMHFTDVQIEQLKPLLASIKSTYLNSGYSPPARQAAVTQNLYPTVFTGAGITSTWNTLSGDSWSTTDNNPVSVNLIDSGYWQNIWSCTPSNPCDFNLTASASPSTVTTGGSVALTYACSGSSCSGVTYSWSGNGVSGSGSPLNITAPSTAGTYTYTITGSKSGCSNKTSTVQITVNAGGSNPCGFTDKQTIGIWTSNNYLIQTRLYTVNGSSAWLLVSADPDSTSIDKHFPRGANFVTRTDINWNNGAPSESCFGGGETGWGGLAIPDGITTPSGYTRGTTADGAIFFEQSGGCTPPAAPSLSASPSTITSGSSSTLSASGCSGGTVTWSDGLGTGTSKSVSPTATKTYSATCSIGSCISNSSNVTVTVNSSGGPNCSHLEGFFDGANCDYLNGWAYDNSSPNTMVHVDIYEGSTLIAGNIAADNFRQDLVDAGKGNGIHGFSIPTPSPLKDGQSHSLTIKITGCTNFSLSNSPRTISGCSGGCTTPSAPSLSASPSSISSGSSSTLSASGCSGGTITWSDGLGTGTSKSVSPTATKTYTATCSINSCVSSNGSVTVTVTSGTNCSNLASDVNGANCLVIEGWAFDQSNPSSTVHIDVYDGATLLISNYPVDHFRQDILDAGMGDGHHAFEISTPSQLKDGQSHTLTFKVSGCTYELNSSPRILSGCSSGSVMLDPDGNDAASLSGKSSLSIFPNPNNGIFDASFLIARGRKATLVISDLQGRTLYKKTLIGTGLMSKEKINLIGKSSGTLLVQLYNESGVEVKKINIVR